MERKQLSRIKLHLYYQNPFVVFVPRVLHDSFGAEMLEIGRQFSSVLSLPSEKFSVAIFLRNHGLTAIIQHFPRYDSVSIFYQAVQRG